MLDRDATLAGSPSDVRAMTQVVATSSHGGVAPSFRVRVLLPGRAMRAFGVELEARPLLAGDDELRFRAGGSVTKARVLAASHRRLRRRLAGLSGTVLVQRQIDLFPSLALERLAAAGDRLVYDVDDAIWNAGDPAAGGHAFAALKRSAHKAAWLAERADQIVAGNDYLAEWLTAHSSAPVNVIPSLVDVDGTPVRRHEEAESVLFGWIGSSTTRPHLEKIRPALEAAAKAMPGRVEFEILGGTTMEVKGVRVRSVAWTPEAERSLLARMDVGVMPLPDTPWTRGKCAYKAQQYMAAGIPVIADDVGVSAQVIGDGAAGLLPTGDAAWTEALVTLALDAGLRTTMGREGRARAERDFSATTRAPELAKLISG